MTGASSSFYVTGGTLRHDAPSYVERRADRELLEGLRTGEFCYVLTSRQMGKSSLMVRTAARLRESGTRVIVLDLTAIGQNVTPEQWYDGLLGRIGRQLDLEEEMEDYWQEHMRLSPVQRLFATIRDVALVQRPGPHVVFIDEIDMVRSLDFSTDEFFAAIRECYNRRSEDPELGRLSFCLLGVATPSDLVKDTRITPFNIGRRIELRDFLADEAQPLTKGLASSQPGALPPEDVLARMLLWTNGHPYLTQRLCLAAAQANGDPDRTLQDPADVDALCNEMFFGERARERDDNLLFVRGRLLRAEVELAGLLQLYDEVLKGRPVRDDERDPLVSVLRLAGIVRLEEGLLLARNRIYERVFDRAWVRAQMPDAELERQRAAFARGVVRTTIIAAVVVVALSIAVIVAVHQTSKAERSLAESHFSRARLIRKSGLVGQRTDSIRAVDAARAHYTDVAALRDEALACLALIDLRESPREAARLPTNTLAALSPDLEVWAESRDGGVIAVHQVRDSRLLDSLPGSSSSQSVERLRFGASGSSWLAAEYGGMAQTQVVVWNWRTSQRLLELTNGITGEAIDFSSDGRQLAVGRPEGRVEVFALPEGKLKSALELKLDIREPRAPHAIRFNPSGDLLAISSLDDQYVEFWRPVVTQYVGRAYHAGLVRDLAWHPEGQLLAAACDDSRVYLWHTNNLRKERRLIGHERAVTALAFNPQGTLLASLGEDETVRLWIPATERQLAGGIASEGFDRILFSTNGGKLIASNRRPTRSRVWEVCGGELKVLQAATGEEKVRTIDFSPDSRSLLTVDSGRMTIWEISTGRAVETVPLPNPFAAGFASDGSNVVASSDSGLYKWQLCQSPARLRAGVTQRLCEVSAIDGSFKGLQWGAETNARLKSKAVTDLGTMAMSLDRSTVAVVQRNALHLLSLDPSGASDWKLYSRDAYYSLLALHPQAEWLASRKLDSDELFLWNLQDASGEFVPARMRSSIYFAFSPDGRWLATCLEGEFRFYHVGDWGKPALGIPRLLASDQHAPMAFSRDGRTVALAAGRYLIQLHQLPAAAGGETRLIATLESPERLPLESLAFSPDNRHLAAATDGQTVLLWDLAALGEGLTNLGLRQEWPSTP